jgi:hypothetical protein
MMAPSIVDLFYKYINPEVDYGADPATVTFDKLCLTCQRTKIQTK